MFLKLFQGFQAVQGRCVCVQGFAKKIHTQMCLASLFDQRVKIDKEWKKVENEWNDDEDEQRRIFHEEESRNFQEKKQIKCEMTGKPKRIGSVDCNCKSICTAKKSETYTIQYEGGVGIIPTN
jgi:hypothetical protein